jgi:16S rRNA (uracil1498-N3)-methyltransferase
LKGKIADHHRFFIPPEYPDSRGTVRFSREESRHMTASLRVRKGDMVTATDGRGNAYSLAVDNAAGREVLARVVSVKHFEREGPAVHLFQAVVKPSKMELIVEKTTELGLWGFIPVLSARSDARMGRIRMERLRRAAIEAMKQSLGTYVPDVLDPVDFIEAAGMMGGFDSILVGREGEGSGPLHRVLDRRPKGRIALWIGPAGGFTQDEAATIADCGGVFFTLGPRRLRSDTAAIASLAVLRQLLS